MEVSITLFVPGQLPKVIDANSDWKTLTTEEKAALAALHQAALAARKDG